MLSGPIKGHRHGKSANQQRPSRDQLWEQPRPDLEIASSIPEARDWLRLRSCGMCSSLSTHPQHLLPPHEMLLEFTAGEGRCLSVAVGWSKHSPSCAHVGLTLEHRLRPIRHFYELRAWLSGLHLQHRGSSKGQQRGFLKDTLWRFLSPQSTLEMSGQHDRRGLGREAHAERIKAPSSGPLYNPLPVLHNKASNRSAWVSPGSDKTRLDMLSDSLLPAWKFYFSSSWNPFMTLGTLRRTCEHLT